MNVIEAIKERKSVRNYNGLPLSSSLREELIKAVNESYSPFKGNVTVKLKEFDLKGNIKPGTYGVIKGALNFFLLGFSDDEESYLSAGFRFEQVVLKAWELGLGTCWLAGTFKESDFDRGEVWPEGESLKIVCPVGVAEKKRLFEKVARFAMGSDKRKPFGEMFFKDGFTEPLSENDKFAKSLEMLRLAPSSTNSQPWRVMVENDAVHFYVIPKSPVSVLDCGIGICHFYQAEKYFGYKGVFERMENDPINHASWKYLTSYHR